MSFKSIGQLAGVVLKEAELAARGHNVGRELKSGGRSAGRRSDQPPTLYVDASTPSGSNGNDGATIPAKGVLGTQCEPSPARGRPVLLVVQGNREGCTAPPTNRSRPTPAVHL